MRQGKRKDSRHPLFMRRTRTDSPSPLLSLVPGRRRRLLTKGDGIRDILLLMRSGISSREDKRRAKKKRSSKGMERVCRFGDIQSIFSLSPYITKDWLGDPPSAQDYTTNDRRTDKKRLSNRKECIWSHVRTHTRSPGFKGTDSRQCKIPLLLVMCCTRCQRSLTPGSSRSLIVIVVACRETRGRGDVALDIRWHAS